MEGRVLFRNAVFPWLLLLPQLVVIGVFFFWPAAQALRQSLFIEDSFGLSARFVGLGNFRFLLSDPWYLASIGTTLLFSLPVAILSMLPALPAAVLVDRVVRGARIYRTLLVLPYGIAPVVSGVLWFFLFAPSTGLVSWLLAQAGHAWNHTLNGGEAMLLVILAATWKQISYNFIFFLAALHAIPRSLLEASAIDGARFRRQLVDIILPLISPTAFFLLVVNLVYAFFDTFGIIHAITGGGPQQATTIMVYKIYADGFIGQDYGSSAAQSVILLVVAGLVTMIQFRYIDRRVHYG